MANWERVEQIHPASDLHELVSYPSKGRAEEGMVPMGSTVWPSVTVLVDDGEGNTTERTIPAPMARNVDGEWVAATPDEVTAHNAAIIAAEELAEQQVVAAMAQAIGPQVEALAVLLDGLGHPIPCDFDTVLTAIATQLPNMTLEQRTNATAAGVLYEALREAVTDDMIVAVKEFMDGQG